MLNRVDPVIDSSKTINLEPTFELCFCRFSYAEIKFRGFL